MSQNNFLIAVVGKATAGKSTCLAGLENPEGVLYINCESGKRLPFPHKFQEVVVSDPYQVHSLFEMAAASDKYHTIVLDSITYLMDMFETVYVSTAADSRAAWGDYQQFVKKLMLELVPKANKVTIVTAHTADSINGESIRETAIPIKGALKNQGIESFFSLVIAAKRKNLKDLEGISNSLLNITERDKKLKYKHVLQTDITAETVYERLRAPRDPITGIGLFSDDEVYIDGNIQLVINQLKQFYK